MNLSFFKKRQLLASLVIFFTCTAYGPRAQAESPDPIVKACEVGVPQMFKVFFNASIENCIFIAQKFATPATHVADCNLYSDQPLQCIALMGKMAMSPNDVRSCKGNLRCMLMKGESTEQAASLQY